MWPVMSRKPFRFVRPFLALLLAVLAGCGVGSQQDVRQTTLFNYAGAIRWGHIDDAWSMVDPQYVKKHPMTALERERFEQVQEIAKSLQHRIKTIIGVSTRISVLEVDGIPRTVVGKARRVIDERPKQ